MKKQVVLVTFIVMLYLPIIKAQNTLAPSLDSVFTNQSVASPEMSSMVRNIVYPVSYSTGLVNISIPLYEIVCNDIKLPIALSYHSSGVKVNEPSGWVGQNWSLECEPMISRTVRGCDDAGAGYKCNIDKKEKVSGWNKFRASQGMIDEQPDEYFFRLADKQGEFMYVMEPKVPGRQYMCIPYQNIQIRQTDGNFFMTDDRGIVYKFNGAREYSIGVFYTGWKASSIVASNLRDSISFHYHDRRETNFIFNDNVTILDQFSSQNGVYADRYQFLLDFNEEYNSHSKSLMVPLPDYWMKDPVVYSTIHNTLDDKYRVLTYQCNEQGELVEDNEFRSNEYYRDNNSDIMAKKLSRINFPTGKIEFSYSLVPGKFNETLDEILVYSKDGTLVKRILFEYINEESKRRSYLSKLVITGKAGAKKEVYSFEYNNTKLLPTLGEKAMDYWGYFNGFAWNDNQSLVPYQVVSATRHHYAGSNSSSTIRQDNDIEFHIGTKYPRTSDEQYMKYGSLRSITYPAGGKDVFEYEGNRIKDSEGKIQVIGGLRIKSITSYEGNNKASVRTFEYGTDGNGYGYAPVEYNLNPFMLEKKRYYMGTVELSFSSTTPLGVPYFDEGRIITARQRTFYSNPVYPITWHGGSSTMYEYVTEYAGTKESNIGKTVYHYAVNKQPVKLEVNRLFLNDKHDSWKYGVLLEKSIYKYVEGSYKLQNDDSYIYRDSKDFGTVWTAETFNPIVDDNHMALRDEHYGMIDRKLVPFKVGAETLTVHESHTYDNGGVQHTVIKTNRYNDSGNSLLCISTNEKNSSGDSLFTKYYYPEDFPGQAPYMNMCTANIYDVVKIEQVKNGKMIGVTTPFLEVRPGLFRTTSQDVSYSTNGNTYMQRLSYKYDMFGNKCEVSKDDKENMVLLYGYNHQYVVARIENATYEDVIAAMPAGEETIKMMANADDFTPLEKNIAILRTTLPKARVTSYTYKPLVGVASITDATGMTTYYEYDELGRLAGSYRNNGNAVEVLEQYNYHYKTEE